MFGPPGSFSDAMPAASHVAGAPAPKAELIDIVGGWQKRAEAICAKAPTPVHYRQAEQDHLWIVDEGEVASFARRFTASTRVEAAMMPDSAHFMDFHTISLASHLQQLGFAAQRAVPA